jgi:hypothetical protein
MHWALSYFKSRCAVTFADWNNFTLEFTSAFCPENKVITATGI